MIRHILTMSTGTLASRALGFLRDSLIAALLGAGPIADAFLVAFQFINVARRSFTEGALNAALVPGYLRVRESEGRAAAAAFAGRVLGSVSLIMIVIALALTLLMPWVMSVLAPGFVGRDTLQLAVDDARLMMPYFAFVGPAIVMMGCTWAKLTSSHASGFNAGAVIITADNRISTETGATQTESSPFSRRLR